MTMPNSITYIIQYQPPCPSNIVLDKFYYTKNGFAWTVKAPTFFTYPQNLFLIKMKGTNKIVTKEISLSLNQELLPHNSSCLWMFYVTCTMVIKVWVKVQVLSLFHLWCNVDSLWIVIVSTYKVNFVTFCTLKILCFHCIQKTTSIHRLEANCTQL